MTPPAAKNAPPRPGFQTLEKTEAKSSKGWKIVRLGDVAKTSSGGTPKRGVAAYYGGEIPWVKSGELGDSTVYETQEKISKAGLDNSSAKLFPAGTLCVALYGATVGKLGILGMDAATNQAVCGIFLPDEIDTRFAYRFLESKRRDLIEMGKGGAQSNISQEIIRDLQFPFPLPNEQRRIVAEIEKQFTRLEAGVSALKRVQANLKRYRAAVITVATRARKNWYETTSGELCEYITSGSRDWKSYYSDTGPLFIRTQDINRDSLNLSEVAHVNLPEKVEGKRSRVRPGDLLVTITGANVGKVALVPNDIPEAYVSQSVGLMRLKDNRNGPYLHYYLQGDQTGRKQVLDMVYGIGRPVLSLQNLRDVPISLPPLAEQARIVAEVERRLSVVEELEAVVSANLQRATRLRQSILQKAFEGKLV